MTLGTTGGSDRSMATRMALDCRQENSLSVTRMNFEIIGRHWMTLELSNSMGNRIN